MSRIIFAATCFGTLMVCSIASSAASISEKCAKLTYSGESELGNGNLTSASKFLEEAVEVCNQAPEKSARPYIAYGKLMYERQNPEGAIKWFKRALQDEPNLPLAYMNISAAYFQRRDYQNAVDFGTQAVSSIENQIDNYDPEEAKSLIAKSAFNVGLAYIAIGGIRNDVSYAKKAEPYFLKTSQYKPEFNQTYYQLGIIKEAAYQDFKAAANYYAQSCNMGYTKACDWNDGLKDRIPQYRKPLHGVSP